MPVLLAIVLPSIVHAVLCVVGDPVKASPRPPFETMRLSRIVAEQVVTVLVNASEVLL